VIELAGVSYAYPDTSRYVLADLDLSVGDGQIVGVVGASGAGKTTLAKIIAGFIPSIEGGTLSGTVEVNGVEISKLTLTEAVAQVGLVTQNPFNQISGAKFTVLEEIAFGLENTGVPRAEMEQRVHETAHLLRVDHLLDRSPYALSGGQMQLVAIASMVVMRTPVLILDEPTSQLDPGGSRMVFDVIEQLTDGGVSVLIFEHKVELLREHSDHVAVLADGRIVASGSPREMLADPRLEDWAIGTTRYTRAGYQAIARGLKRDASPLPVSLPDAVSYFTHEGSG